VASQADQRTAALRARRALSDEQRLVASKRIAERVFRSNWFYRATNLGCYLPTTDEVNTWPIIERAWAMKKRIFVPRIKKTSHIVLAPLKPESRLTANRFGIAEPDGDETLPIERLDVFLTPLAAFDRDGHRIGMGGGFIDRSFAGLKQRRLYRRPKLIGLAFSCQESPAIAASPWDIPLFSVITETETL